MAGKLELEATQIRLEGRDLHGSASCTLPYLDLVAIHIGREASERLDGRPTLLLERSGGAKVRIAALVQAGIVVELAEKLATVETGPRAASG